MIKDKRNVQIMQTFQEMTKPIQIQRSFSRYVVTMSGGTYLYFGWGCASQVFKSWPYFRPEEAVLYTLFQTKLQKSISYFSQDDIRTTMKGPTRTPWLQHRPYFFIFQYSEICEVTIQDINLWANYETFYDRPQNLCEKRTLFQTYQAKSSKCIIYSRPDYYENHTLNCDTYPYSQVRGAPPPPG